MREFDVFQLEGMSGEDDASSSATKAKVPLMVGDLVSRNT